MSRYERCFEVEAVASARGVGVNYRCHICFERKASRIERRVRGLHLEIERSELPAEFTGWLGAHENHEEWLARRLAFDAFERLGCKDVQGLIRLPTSPEFVGRN
jgi:hypothetical protein